MLEYDAEQFAEQEIPMLVVGTKEVGVALIKNK